jgi:hypothetical protein
MGTIKTPRERERMVTKINGVERIGARYLCLEEEAITFQSITRGILLYYLS